jgi:transcriptional regulator with XRE-family HTH domain
MRQLQKCPDCGARLIPRPKEIRDLRLLARLSQRELANYLGVKSSHVAYLETGRRSPSGDLILRYRKVERRLLSKIGLKMAS